MLHSSSALFSKQAPKLEKSFLDDLQSQFGLQHVALDVGERQDDMEKLQSWAKGGMGGRDISRSSEPGTEDQSWNHDPGQCTAL